MSLSANQIIDVLKNIYTIDEYVEGININSLELGEIKTIEKNTSRYEITVINYFVDHNVYIKTTGWRTSYHKPVYDSWGEEVFPKTKQIIIYE